MIGYDLKRRFGAPAEQLGTMGPHEGGGSFGFIGTDFGDSIFVHRGDCPRGVLPRENSRVIFTRARDADRRDRALDVRPLTGRG
jgi:hypothetical protein